jgi:beta-galactosidase
MTKSTLILFSIILAILSFNSCAETEIDPAPREMRFNDDWKFVRSDIPGAGNYDFDDSGWRVVDLPHDWSIEDVPPKEGVRQVGPFSEESAGGISTGHVIGGTGWYRKSFTLARDDDNKIIKVLFDGVYMDSEVWINGVYLGRHPYGYTAFFYDLTDHLRPSGEKNVLAVRVNNEGSNSRWYSGSGIYRNVTLIRTAPVYIDIWGNYITTPVVSPSSSVVSVETRIINSTARDVNITAEVYIIDPAGETVSVSTKEIRTGPDEPVFVTQEMEVIDPRLWDTETPNLYTAVVQLKDGGRVIDRTLTRFGIRSIEFSPERGFLLNGKSTLLKGACIHHDNGPLGAAAFDHAEFRKVEIMKSNGFNAIRTAHNPFSTAFLEACDRLGMLVINEAFDHWQIPKNPNDYHRFFDDWWDKDMESMLLRDRNHPSVIIWSIGNEIKERADPDGLRTARMLKAKLRTLDRTRPVTQGVSEFWETPGRPWEESAPVFDLLDVHGYNYMWKHYEEDHEKYSHRIMIGTESFPMESFENWQMAEKHPYVIGDFVWTGMDYFGESGIGNTWLDTDDISFLPPWPWFNAWCGDISVLGYKKPQMFYRDVVWRNSLIEMLVHAPVPEGSTQVISRWGWPNEHKSWNWEGHEGTPLQVSVYTRAPRVRLELSGEVIGVKDVSEDTRLMATFDVPYRPGELVAVALDGETELARQVLRTAGEPFRLMIRAERDTIAASAGDLAYFNIEVVDENGLIVPNAEIAVEFILEGQGTLQAVGNGNPTGMKSFQQPRVLTYEGRCQLIVRSGHDPGEIVVYARSPEAVTGKGRVVIAGDFRDGRGTGVRRSSGNRK